MAIHLLESAALTDLSAAKKLALMAFADSADKDTRVAIPGFATILQWSGLKRSQAYDVIAELVDLGYLARRSGGRNGRRAEFLVFPAGGCCPLHGPVAGWETAAAEAPRDAAGPEKSESGQPDPASVDEPVHISVDTPVDEVSTSAPGSGEGSGSGSGLDRTPSRLPGSEEPPNPPANRGTTNRCPRPGHAERPGRNCRTCGTSPRGAEQRAHQSAVEAAVTAIAAIERDRDELPPCRHPDCDPDTRWRSPDEGPASRCPACHPDLVIGRPTADQLALARFAPALSR